jgi:TRAP-type transport system periplasmic protein
VLQSLRKLLMAIFRNGRPLFKQRKLKASVTTVLSSPTIKLGGYQGVNSVLSRGLLNLQNLLASAPDLGSVHAETDVTQSGETAASLFAGVESGNRQICYMASGYLAARVPELGVLDLPFSIRNRSAALAALDDEAGHWIKQAVEAKTGYVVLGFWDNGFRHISNSRGRISTPTHCQGLCIRTLNNPNYKLTLEALGFSVRITDVKDLVHVIETGQVQAQENPLTNLLNFDIWKHHPFVSLTGHYFGIALVLCHRRWFESLQAGAQEVLRSSVDVSTKKQRREASREDKKAIEFLLEQHVQIESQADLDLSAMKAVADLANSALRNSVPPELLRLYLEGQ